jgi:hypothetical protein
MHNLPLIKGQEECMTMSFGDIKIDLECTADRIVVAKNKLVNLSIASLEGKSKPQVVGCTVNVVFVKHTPRQTDKGKEY